MAEAQNAYLITWGMNGVTPITAPNLGASVTSDPFPVSRATAFSVDLNFTLASAPVGTFDLQVCNVPVRDNKLQAEDAADANWVSIGVSVTAGTNPPPAMLTVTASAFSWARLVYTRSSGGASDTATAWVQARVI